MLKKPRISVNRKNIVLYMLIVGLPLYLFSYIYLHYKTNHVYSELEETANRYSSFHALYFENFIGETIGRMESMAMMLSEHDHDSNLIENLLVKTHQKDPRFSGFYWVNPKGDITNSSNPIMDKFNVANRAYFQEAMRTGETQISEAHTGMVTGRYVFSIATPVINQASQITGLLIGSVQLYVMEEIVRELARGETVRLIDETGQVLLQTKQHHPDRWVGSSIQLEAVPWKVHSLVQLDYTNSILKPFVQNLVIAILLTNILFLLIQWLLIKQKMARELSRIEADKLKLIGIIAASTAHEIRNPLTGIKGFISLLSKKYKDAKDQYYFSLIQKEVDRINTIVSELLVIGKPTVASKETVMVNDILTEMIPLIESEAHLYHVELSVRMTTRPVYTKISKDHFKQIVLNLTKNALESMEKGGQLLISSERTEAHVLITIKDTGHGMSPEVIRDLFIPFFTMKENGTGLGLVVCKRILDSYGGTLLVNSQEGAGTQVTIQLPLAQAGRNPIA